MIVGHGAPQAHGAASRRELDGITKKVVNHSLEFLGIDIDICLDLVYGNIKFQSLLLRQRHE